MNNIYLIAANGTGNFKQELFHNFVINILYPNYVTSWWHYLSGPTYLVATKLNENQLFNLTKKHMNDHHFLIIKVDSTTAQGWLPKKAWTWMGRS